MSRFVLPLFACLSWLFTVSGQIIEMPHFRHVLNYLTPGSWVILDIDDTLMITNQMLGCDEWFLHRIKQKINEQHLSQTDALGEAVEEWEAVRKLTKVQIVEPETDKIIRQIQQKGYTVMALTTQGFGIASRTCQLLHAINIDLTKTAPSYVDHYFMNVLGVLYQEGILFTSGTQKGKAFLKFCDVIKTVYPKRVIFVNDKKSHLDEMEKMLQERGLEFIGLRYSYSDAKKAAFRPEIAEIQYHHSSFAHILSDEEAEVYQSMLAN